tara:strand:+ start:263 stop:979 length:717 start_codon:yes stop_codon:yes gene_type:complete
MKITRATIYLSIASLTAFAGADVANGAPVSLVTINGLTYDLDQFDGASVTYRADVDSTVSFDGKRWDQAAGVDGYTLGELAAGQYGSDPGDQISLNNRTTPDWLQLNYGTPFTLSSTANQLVIHEISSYTYVDPEGLSFNISINGGAMISASAATATNYNAGLGPDGQAEDANQLVFDFFSLGFSLGDSITSIYIENIDSGSGTSDPDFIFAGITIPAPSSLALLGMGSLIANRRRRA